MFDRMVHEHGYSIRKLADKLGKDKGYLENRLRLADAPEEIRELVSLRKDTVSHAYELMKVQDPKKRRKLAGQVASGELSLVKLREKIEGRRPRVAGRGAAVGRRHGRATSRRPPTTRRTTVTGPRPAAGPLDGRLARPGAAPAERRGRGPRLGPALPRRRPVAPEVDRANLAKYLMIAKLKLENAIAVIRTRRRRASADPTPSDELRSRRHRRRLRRAWGPAAVRGEAVAERRISASAWRGYLCFDFPCVAVVAAPAVSWPWFCFATLLTYAP